MKKVILLTVLLFFYLPKGEGQELENIYNGSIWWEIGGGMHYNSALIKPFFLPLCIEGCDQVSFQGRWSSQLHTQFKWPIRENHHLITGVYFQWRKTHQELLDNFGGGVFPLESNIFYFGGQFGFESHLSQRKKIHFSFSNSVIIEYGEYFELIDGIGLNYLGELNLDFLNKDRNSITTISPFVMIALLPYPIYSKYLPISVGVSASISSRIEKKK